MLHGVQMVPLRRIHDERGMVMHMLRNDDPHFTEIGEIFFSVVYPGVIKGWHLHSRMTVNLRQLFHTIGVSNMNDYV